MKTVDITPPGATILNARHWIPELAKATLNKYANNRLKDLKYVTKAFKYQFPFYETIHRKRAFTKVFTVLTKNLQRTIPYIDNAKIKFIDIPREASDCIYIRLGPVIAGATDARERRKSSSLYRYLIKVSSLARRHGLPLHITTDFTKYIKPSGRSPYQTYYADPVEQLRNTYDILEVRIRFVSSMGETGYLLLMYTPEIMKILETLHRHAHYADTTYRTNSR